jgi:preprotein translocase subunit SecF
MRGGQGTQPSRAASGAERAPAAAPRFFTLIPPDINIDFVGLRYKMIAMSWGLIAIGLMSIFGFGRFNFGIDFAGGTMVHVKFKQPPKIAEVRAALKGPDLRDIAVQELGEGQFQVRVRSPESGDDAVPRAEIRKSLTDQFGEGSYEVLREETVGPKVGRELWRSAMLAVLFATVMMGVYIAVRFDFRFGLGAAVALVHDVLITLGALSIANMEFDLTTVAALLTIVGFSVNDTVIISDRIREDMRKMRRDSLGVVINRAINETLSRTIITSGTAVLVTAALFLVGGPVIHSFAFALLVGFIVGTYSSIYVAAPIVLFLEGRKPSRR